MKVMFHRCFFLFCMGLFASFGATSGIYAADLNATEQAIISAVDTNQDTALQLLERVVNINSGSLSFAGVKAVGEVFQKEFETLGFETRWADGKAWNRAGHLIATHGDRGKHFVLIGHLDTVFEPDSPFQKFETTADPNIVKGPGVSDMKGGNVIIVEAIKALLEAGVLDSMIITVVLIGDEESSGRPFSLSRADLREAAKAADIALAFESGDDNPTTAVIARRGFTGWRLEVKGKPAHSSQVFKESIGFGAIYETARILNAFREELAGEQYLTFNPGIVLGGTSVNYDAGQARGDAFGKLNVIAETTVVLGDLRTISAEQLARTQQRMRTIVSENLKGASASIEFQEGFPPLAPSVGNLRLLEQYNQVSRDLGFGEVTAVDPGAAGAADVSFTAGLVDMAIDGLGLLGDGSHTIEETADLRTFPMQTKRAAVLMYRLAYQ